MRRVPLVAAGLVVVLLSACSPSQDPIPDPTTPAPVTTSATPTVDPTTPSPDPTTEPPTPTPSETLDPDQIAARDTVDEFFRILNELAKDPSGELQPLADITTGNTQGLFTRSVSDGWERNLIQIGDVQSHVLELGPAEQSGQDVLVRVKACSDSHEIDVVDADTGISALPPERSLFLIWSIDVVTVDGIWKVGDLTNTSAEGCSG